MIRASTVSRKGKTAKGQRGHGWNVQGLRQAACRIKSPAVQGQSPQSSLCLESGSKLAVKVDSEGGGWEIVDVSVGRPRVKGQYVKRGAEKIV